jgi:hypothetical protein
MNWSEWLGSENLKTIGRHTVHCTAAVLGFMWVSWLVRKGLGEGVLRTYIEDIENLVLGVLFLVFLVNVGYDLFKEIRRNVGSGLFVVS